MPKLTIHRGAKEIGGSCVELQSASGERLIIDLGMPLNDEEPDIKWLPNVDGLLKGDPNIKGILVSHAHADHYGLLHLAHKSIPVFMSGYQKRMLNDVACHFVPNSKPCPRAITIEDGSEFSVGNSFKVRPILMDHSAFGGFSFLVEIDGKKRVLYSGDFRGHGRANLLGRFCMAAPKDVDVLLMEGTTLSRKTGDAAGSGLGMRFKTEKEIAGRFQAEFAKAGDKLCTVMCSGQNISRLAGIASAATRAGRTFVVDFYTAQAILATQHPAFVGQLRKYMGVYVAKNQGLVIVRNNLTSKLNALESQRIYLPSQRKQYREKSPEKAATRHFAPKYDFLEPSMQSKFVFLVNGSVWKDLKKEGGLAFAHPIYSMWEGYWRKPEKMRWQADLVRTAGFEKPLLIHTSGHASPSDLKRYAMAAKPKLLVPIHTEAAKDYAQLYPGGKVRVAEDDEWIDL